MESSLWNSDLRGLKRDPQFRANRQNQQEPEKDDMQLVKLFLSGYKDSDGTSYQIEKQPDATEGFSSVWPGLRFLAGFGFGIL
jgi:hypothetical protein